MGAYLVLRMLIRKDAIKEFFSEFKTLKRIGYYSDDEEYKLVFCTAWLGYAEPLEMYKKYKDVIKDIWCMDISFANELIGRNCRDSWWSVKKEFKNQGDE